MLHGIGGSEEQLMPYTNLKVPARLVYVRGPFPNGAGPNAGYSYFKARFTAAGFMAAGYKGDFSRVKAGHALATLGKHIAPLLTTTLDPQPARPSLAAQLRAR